MADPTDGVSAGRFRQATTGLLRDTTLDALRELLVQREWSAITMTDVATAVGVSRQSLYNEFGSRKGLAHAYAIRLTGVLVSVVESALYQHLDNAHRALEEGFTAFFALAGSDPLVMSLHRGKPPEDLLRLITTDSHIVIEPASANLARSFRESWVEASERNADIIATAIVRLAVGYVAKPPAEPSTTALELADLLTPFIEHAAG